MILITPLVTSAQVKPIGYFIDNSGYEINDYAELDYVPYAPFVYSESIDEFQVGAYVDLNGEIHKGRIKLNNPNNKISFKKFLFDDTIVVLKAEEVKSFYVASDTFEVFQDYETKFASYKTGFMLKYLKLNSISFYKHFSKEGNVEYFLKVDGSFNRIPENRKKFISLLSPLVKDYEILCNDIKNGIFRFDDLGTILKILQIYTEYRNNSTTFYSKNWQVVSSKTNAIFYSKAIKLDGYLADIAYFDISGNKILDIKRKRLDKVDDSGEFIWYYPNGEVRKRSKTENENIHSEEYYPNGKLHYAYIDYSGWERVFNIVNDSSGIDILKKNGEEQLLDVTNNRLITRRYEEGELQESFYYDSAGNKIYQQTKRNAEMKTQIISSIEESLFFPQTAKDSLLSGTILIRTIINSYGQVDSYKIIKGISLSVDNSVLNVFKSVCSDGKKSFSPASNGKEKVYQELVFPVVYGFNTMDTSKSLYYEPANNFWQWRQMQDNFFPTQSIKIPDSILKMH